MIPNTYHSLYNKTKEHVAQVRGIQTVGSVNYEDLCRVYHRAAQLTLLDILLEEHREKHKTTFNDLRGKQCLHHLLLSKFSWPLSQIQTLSLSDVLLLLHDDLRTDKVDSAAGKYIDGAISSYHHFLFSDVKDEEWDPDILEQLLQSTRW